MVSNNGFMPLRELSVRITKGTTPTKGQGFVSQGINYIKSESITPAGTIDKSKFAFIDERTHAALERSQLRAGNVLFSMAGVYLGKTAVVQQEYLPANTNQAVGIISLDESKADPYFIHYALQSPECRGWVARSAAQSAQPNFNLKEIGDLPIPKFSLPVQKQISENLRALDSKIALSRRINQTLEAMAQAIFKSWFVDFDPVRAKISAIAEGRDPLRAAMSAISGKPDAELDALPPEQYEQLAATAILFPEEMEDSELSEIPRSWSVSKVETLLSRLSAKTRYTREQVSEYGQIPVFEQGASILLGFHNGAASYPASSENPMFIFGDHTCVTRLSCQPFDISQNVIPLQGQGRATAWVYYAVKEKQKFQEYRRHWMELISKDVVVAAPGICLEFSRKVSNLHLQMEANERQTQSLRELRDTLIPKLLSGELTVEALAESAGIA